MGKCCYGFDLSMLMLILQHLVWSWSLWCFNMLFNCYFKECFNAKGRDRMASALRMRAKKCEQETTARGAGVGRGGGVGRYSLSISFHPCSSVRVSCHYIQPTCISERLVWNSLNQYKLSLVFVLDRPVDASQISFPNLPSPGFVIL